MEKRIIYSDKCTIKNLMLEAEKSMKICGEEIDEVYLMGLILRRSQRKLLGIIPLPNKYTYKVFPHIYVRNKYTDTVSTAKPNVLSFESKKRLMEETRNLESWLRNKCKQYKQSKQDEKADGEGSKTPTPSAFSFIIKSSHTTKSCLLDGRCPRQGESCVRVRKTSVAVGCGRETMNGESRYDWST